MATAQSNVDSACVEPAGNAPSEAGAQRGRPHRIVVGIDGSPSADRALARAAAMIDETGLLVLVAVERELLSAGIVAAPLLDADDVDAAWVLRNARTQLPPDCAACLAVSRCGDPAEVLSEVAREHGADLVVVGRRGRDFAARVLLGSVAGRLVVDAPCDVLVVQ